MVVLRTSREEMEEEYQMVVVQANRGIELRDEPGGVFEF